MSQDPRVERALSLISELADEGDRPVSEQTRLRDIGFDSLAFVELAAALEADLDAELDGSDLSYDRTIGDVCARWSAPVAGRCGPPSRPAPAGRAPPELPAGRESRSRSDRRSSRAASTTIASAGDWPPE